MTEKKTVPKVRFDGFDGEWVEKELEYLADYAKGSGYSKADLVEEGFPIILYGRLYTKYETVISQIDTFVNDNSSAVISKGNEVIVPASGETAEDISRASVVEHKGVVLGGDLNIIYLRNEIDAVFLALSISNGSQKREMMKRAQGKTVVHLHNSDLKKVILCYPRDIKEQTAIGNFFRTLDETITLKNQQHEKLVNIKKAMLEKMFPKKGADVPEIRFEGFTEEWSQYLLGDLFVERSERSSEGELISVTINLGVVKASSLARRDSSSEDKSNYKKVEIGDIAYNSMRMWQGASGVSRFSGILSPAYTVIIPNDGVNSLFFSYVFKLPEKIIVFQANSQGMTSDTWNLKFSSLKNIVIECPSYDEQAAIGNFFCNLDNLIESQWKELEKLQNIKKACLNKMFV